MVFFAFAKNIEAVVFICDLYIWNLLVSYTGKDSIPLACYNLVSSQTLISADTETHTKVQTHSVPLILHASDFWFGLALFSFCLIFASFVLIKKLCPFPFRHILFV